MHILQNISNEHTPAPSTLPTRYVVAVLSAWTAETVTYPFDFIKTRLQIQSEVATAKHGYKLENKGMFGTAAGIVKNEGFFKLWSGVMPMCHRHAVYAGCRLVIYEKYRILVRDENGYMSLPKQTFGGLFSGALAQLIASPTDLIKVHMQAEGRRLLQGKPPLFKSCWQAYARVYQTSGILGFWRGALPSVQRAALVNLGDLAAYDASKQFLLRDMQMPDSMTVHLISAVIAGFVAATLSTPADVMKTRLMNQPIGPDGRGKLYSGMIDCIKQSVKNEGMFALYKGFLPVWIRLGPWALINWITFENIMIATGHKTF